jgi:hypothetical protein
MDTLTFIAEVVKAAAWPLTVGIILFALRKEIVALLPYLQKLKYKDLELEFKQSVKQLVSESEDAKLNVPSKTSDEKKNRVLALADLLPRSAIIEAWLEVESAAAESIVGVNKVFFERTYMSPLQLSRFLVRSEILDNKKAEIFSKLRNLRNIAAHSPEFELPLSEVKEYVDLAFSLSNYIREKTKIPNKHDNKSSINHATKI